MKNLLLFCILVTALSSQLQAQEALTTVNLDLIQNRINGGMPLPAEEKFYIQGAIPNEVGLVKVELFPSKKSDKTKNTYYWKPPFGYKELSFHILVEHPLRSSEDYQIEFSFFQKATQDEVAELRKLIKSNLSSYLNTITSIKKGGVVFEDSNDQILNNSNEIVEAGLRYFALPDGASFPGFSDLTRKKLEQRKKLKMGDAKFNIFGKSKEEDARVVYANKYLEELQGILFSEVDQFLSYNLLAIVDEKKFMNYPTEKKPNSIPLNIGYGAIPLSKNLQSKEYVHSPYVGFSFPLGNRTFAKFMSNMSVSAGMFLSKDMENSMGERIGGVAFDRPVYVGLGYNFFRFLRLNAGGTFLNTEKLNGSTFNDFQPFVGLSAEFRLWVGFGDKK
ncbi:hypothetical protein J0A68_16525 [Algoriphagus sp. H41]|uniref:Outer membrane protein beta-barrel domain-containing protein n=1 Tax=Algoriphagus oliviformis TaxID=2811231 RepID=A0ABS3C7M5_9BACT|nr:hypothetical protein [Algoriphagus oliviformis]MBN7812561.1 hypothetical protein [Algoriphagus oliviformis]